MTDLDDIEVDADGKCNWTDVAYVGDKMRRELIEAIDLIQDLLGLALGSGDRALAFLERHSPKETVESNPPSFDGTTYGDPFQP